MRVYAQNGDIVEPATMIRLLWGELERLSASRIAGSTDQPSPSPVPAESGVPPAETGKALERIAAFFRAAGQWGTATLVASLVSTLAFLVIFFVVWGLQVSKEYQQAERVLLPEIDRFGQTISKALTVPHAEEAYLMGKPMILNGKPGRLRLCGSVHLMLPPDLKPEKAGEIGSLVLVEESEVPTGEVYNDGKPATRIKYAVTVVDAVLGLVVAQEEFLGGNPPSTRRKYETPHGSSPDAEVVAYLGSLPRRGLPPGNPSLP
jgi:hypothetical protein